MESVTRYEGILKRILDRALVRRMAGVQSFERGEDYFDTGHVRGLAEEKGTIKAKVLGSREYRVKLWVKDDDLEFSCSCPVGLDGAFCKHCVAVALAWLERGIGCTPVPGEAAGATLTMNDIRTYLAGQTKNALAGMLLEQAMEDDRLRQRLLMKAAKKGRGGPDLATYRAAIADAVSPDGFVGYREMYDYSQGIEDAIDSIEELLGDGLAAEAIELSEHALAAVEGAMESVDDSDGYMGGILDRLQDLHLRACKKAKPESEELARRLFNWELRTDWDTFYGAAETYAGILGTNGLAVYRSLAEAEWARVPELRPGQEGRDRHGKRSRITHIMETLAGQSGNVEAVVAVKQRDLSYAYAYLEIAEAYKRARKNDLALEWAERGLKAFPERTDSRLREFLVGEYHRRKRHDEAMTLVWAEFTEHGSLEQYQDLKAHADRIGEWPAWREKALEFMREKAGAAKRETPKNRWDWSIRADRSELVRVFLWERDVEAAWREAQEGGCSNDLWMKLAAERGKDHPEDAVPIYQKQIDPTLARKNNEAYEAAVGLLREIHGLMDRLGERDEFARYLASVRAAHKPKRNFMKLLDRAKWA